jgi:hypothetical protein
MRLNKDEILDRLAERGNVAQFIAFRPGPDGEPAQSFSRLAGYQPNYKFDSLESAAATLLDYASDGSLNVRSYLPESPRSQEFLYGLRDVDAVVAAVRRLSAAGLHTIINETIDVYDGGVSGVLQGDIVEFSPDDTPRCVEKPGTVQLPFVVAMRLLETVYGFEPDLPPGTSRIEFSIHPKRRGVRAGHTLLWEYEEDVTPPGAARIAWPNRFSRHLGDKAYGLLIGFLLGAPVPRTLVIGRRVAPFSFGVNTGICETWTRTCPIEPEPGLFTTARGWIDPFALLANEDPDGDRIASVLNQQAVAAMYAGAAIAARDGVIIEGKVGEGDSFMLGNAGPETLPATIVAEVLALYESLASELGPLRLEWVHDGAKAWLVQLHHGGTESSGSVLVPGDAALWVRFKVIDGLEALRALASDLPTGTGIELVGHVGLTSHIADVVRRAARPTRIAPATD